MNNAVVFIYYLIVILQLGFYYDLIKDFFGGGVWFVLATGIYLLVFYFIATIVRNRLLGNVDTHE